MACAARDVEEGADRGSVNALVRECCAWGCKKARENWCAVRMTGDDDNALEMAVRGESDTRANFFDVAKFVLGL